MCAVAQEEQIHVTAILSCLKGNQMSSTWADIAKQQVLPTEEVMLCQWIQDQGAAGMYYGGLSINRPLNQLG
jgi:hypothetical protein